MAERIRARGQRAHVHALDVRDAFDRQLDYIVDAGATGVEPTTIVDLTPAVPQILRLGKGSAEALGLEPVEA